jgi:hypothetical protein
MDGVTPIQTARAAREGDTSRAGAAGWLPVPSVPVSGHGGQMTLAVTGVTCPAVTVAVVTPGWQPERLVMTV